MVWYTNFSQVPGVTYGTMSEDIQRILAWFPISPGLVTAWIFPEQSQNLLPVSLHWLKVMYFLKECQCRLKWLKFVS